jgi:hypothetical protein
LASADVVIADRPPTAGERLPSTAFVIVRTDRMPGLMSEQSELAVQAALGLIGYLGTPESPIISRAHIASVTCAFHITHAVLAAMVAPRKPAIVEVSPARSLSTVKSIVWAARTHPDAWDGYHLSAQRRPPDNGYRVRDGRITLEFPHTARVGWVEFCLRLGVPFLVDELGDDWHMSVGVDGYAHPSSEHYRSALIGLRSREACELVRSFGGWAFPFRPHNGTSSVGGSAVAGAWSIRSIPAPLKRERQ